MYFTFKCPACGKALKVREEIAGRRCGCPYCNKTIVVPPPLPPSDEPPSELDDLKGLKSTLSDKRKSRKKGGKPAAHQAGGAGGLSAGTDVSMIISGLIAVGVTVGFFALMIPLTGTYIGDMFLMRGWVPYALVFLMSWSAAILFLKSRKLAQQRKSMLFDLLPTELAAEISEDTVDKFVRHIHGLPVEPSQSFLINRVLRGLETFRVRKSNPETASMLASQSDIDATAVESSYTLLKVFIWAIPILGFIGTVIGISAAVGGFSGSLDTATDVSELKTSLGAITSGLATAFETTLVALVMSLLVMFPTSSMQKSEEDLLNWVDEYCNENLLRRLDDGGSQFSALAGGGGDVARAIDAALAAQRIELEKWNKTFKSIGSILTENVVKGWEKITEQMAEQQAAREAQIKELDRTIEEFQKSMAALTAETTKTGDQIARPLGERFAELQRGLEGLNENLQRLSDKEVVVQTVPKRRWGWFSRSGDGK